MNLANPEILESIFIDYPELYHKLNRKDNYTLNTLPDLQTSFFSTKSFREFKGKCRRILKLTKPFLVFQQENNIELIKKGKNRESLPTGNRDRWITHVHLNPTNIPINIRFMYHRIQLQRR